MSNEDKPSAEFTTWLKNQAEREDPVGDLARDVCIDPDWPGHTRNLETFVAYLERITSWTEPVHALRTAWAEYKEKTDDK